MAGSSGDDVLGGLGCRMMLCRGFGVKGLLELLPSSG